MDSPNNANDIISAIFSNGKRIVRSIIILAVLALIGFAIYKFIKWYKLQRLLAKQKNSYSEYTDTTGNTITINLSEKATEIYSAGHVGWFGWFEDENKIVTTLLSIPKELITKLESVYTSLYGASLQTNVMEWLSDSDFDKVRYLFN